MDIITQKRHLMQLKSVKSESFYIIFCLSWSVFYWKYVYLSPNRRIK
jgi:hypothetical protein